MSKIKVNLEEILFAETDKLRIDLPNIDLYSNEQMKESPEFKYFIKAMKEACRQTLELATNNAKVIKTGWQKKNMPTGIRYKFTPVQIDVMEVDKQSILNLINQIE